MENRTAADIMTRNVVCIGENETLTKAIKLMLKFCISGMPVLDEAGMLTGMITEHDLLNFTFSGTAHETLVKEAMTRDVITFPPETPVQEIINCFAAKRIKRVPIVEGGSVAGIVSRRDILWELDRIYGRIT